MKIYSPKFTCTYNVLGTFPITSSYIVELQNVNAEETLIEYEKVLTDLGQFVDNAKFQHERINTRLGNLNKLIHFKEEVVSTLVYDI